MTKLPSGWTLARVDDVAEVQGGIQKQLKRRPVKNKFPFLRVANLTADGLVLNDVHEVELFDGELERFALRSGDILVVEGNGSLNNLGRAAMWSGEIPHCVHQNHLIRVRPDAGLVDSRYLNLLWNGPIVSRQLRAVAASTSGLHTLSAAKIKAVSLLIPPVTEQRRIAGAVEECLSRLDVGQANLERGIRRSDVIRRKVLDHQIGSPNGTLGEILSGIEAGKSFSCEPRRANRDEWAVIKVSAMTWGEFREDENKAVPVDKDVDPRYEIEPGDLLVSRANTEAYVGAPVLVRDCRPKLLLSDKSLRLKLRPGVSPEWLLLVLSSPKVRRQISDRATGTKESMRNISQNALRAIEIPVVSIEEQLSTVAQINAHMDRIDGAVSQLAQVHNQASSLTRAVLMEAFAGRLVPQDPDDEPASVLLERISAERAEVPKPRRGRKVRVQESAAVPAARGGEIESVPEGVQSELEFGL